MKNYLEHANVSIIIYDEIDRYDGTGRYRKGTPKHYEIDRFQNDFGIDIEYMKKSDFPIIKYYGKRDIEKVKILEEFEVDNYPVTIYRRPMDKRGLVWIHLGNDNQAYLIEKNKIDAIKEMDFTEFDRYFR